MFTAAAEETPGSHAGESPGIFWLEFTEIRKIGHEGPVSLLGDTCHRFVGDAVPRQQGPGGPPGPLGGQQYPGGSPDPWGDKQGPGGANRSLGGQQVPGGPAGSWGATRTLEAQ